MSTGSILPIGRKRSSRKSCAGCGGMPPAPIYPSISDPQIESLVLNEFLQTRAAASDTALRVAERAHAGNRGSLIRKIPRSSAPNTGLTTPSPPNWSNAANAASEFSQTTLSGTGSPAPTSRDVVRYLSTAHSIARGGLQTCTPASSSRVNKFIRNTTCSSRAGGIVRTMTASADERSVSLPQMVDRPVCTCAARRSKGRAVTR